MASANLVAGGTLSQQRKTRCGGIPEFPECFSPFPLARRVAVRDNTPQTSIADEGREKQVQNSRNPGIPPNS